MKTAVSTLWQREHLDDVPEYGLAVVACGEEMEVIKYVPERTCELEEPHSCQPMNLMTCSRCGMKTAVANFCSWCGAKVVV